MKRLDEDARKKKKILSQVVDGTYVGRPKKRWLDDITADMKSANVTKNLTADRMAWRAATKMKERRLTLVTGNRKR